MIHPQILYVAFVHTALGMGLFLVSETVFANKKLLRRLKEHKNHHHHDHDHGAHTHGVHSHAAGHNHSKFSLGIGVSTTMALTKPEEEEHEHEHGFPRLLGINSSRYKGIKKARDDHDHDHGGHDHDHGGHDHGGGDGFAPMFSVEAGYHILNNAELNAEFEFGGEGIEDPSFGGSMEFQHSRRVSSAAFVSATLPFSEESSEQQKMTTLTFGYGPKYVRGRWSVGATALMDYSIYRAAEEEEDHEDEGHIEGATAEMPGEHEHEHEEDDEHEHESEHAHEDEEHEHHHDPQTLSLGGNGKVAYRFGNGFKNAAGVTVLQRQHKSGEATYYVDLVISRVSYTWKAITGTAGYGIKDEKVSLAAPTQHYLKFMINYIYE